MVQVGGAGCKWHRWEVQIVVAWVRGVGGVVQVRAAGLEWHN